MYQYFDRNTLRGLGLGAVERRNPLPAGQYTIDVYGDDRAKMAGWVSTNQAHVVILATANEEAETDAESNDTYTFITAIPIPWDGSFGYPDIMSEVPVTAAPATSQTSTASPLTTTAVYTLPTAKASLVSAPGAEATYSSASPNSSASSSSSTNWKVACAAILLAGGAYYYAKKKGML